MKYGFDEEIAIKEEQLRAAIVGFGRMGQIRKKCISNHPNLHLVAICDTNASKCEADQLPVCTDYRDLLKYKPNVIFACTPNSYLAEIVCFFLRQKAHVFCEKPPGCSTYDVQLMIDAERENPEMKLKFGFNHRYHQAVMEAKSIVDSGRLGKIMWMRGVYGKSGDSDFENLWRNKREISGGGILLDQGIHMIDLFRLFCGEFDEIYSMIGQFYWPVKVEDNAFVLLRNKMGQVGMLHSSATQWQHKFLLDLYLERGYLSLSGIITSTKTYGAESLRIARCLYDEKGYPRPNPEETITYYDDDCSWKLEVDEFVRCILKRKQIEVGFSADALQTMALIERIYASDPKWQTSQSACKGKN